MSCSHNADGTVLAGGSSEDFPKKITAQFLTQLLTHTLGKKKWSAEEVVIFVATDEAQMLADIIQLNPGRKIVYTDSYRSPINTAGKNIDTSRCARGEDNGTAECREYNDMIKYSLHRGFPERCAYTKGKEALLDMLLLAEADLFFRSRGNLSNFPIYIRPDMEYIDLAAAWEEEEGEKEKK